MSDWKVFRVNEIANVIMGQSPSSVSYNDKGLGYPFLQGCADFGKKFPTKKVYCTEPKKIAPKGALLISVRAPVGEANIADSEYCIGRGLAGIVCQKIDQSFLNYRIISQVRDLERVSQGSTFLAINTSDLNNLLINIPISVAEQCKVAYILSSLDTIIEKTEEAIAKYKAIKTGMMHDLFTRGIDLGTDKLRPSYEDAPELYKESELGWIPKDWDVSSLGNDEFFDLATGGTPSTSIDRYWNGNIRWMSSGEVNKKRIYEVDGRITKEGYEHSNARFYPINSIVIGLAGQGKTRGTVAITYVETTSNQSIAAIICSKKYDPHFLYHLLDHQYENLRSVSAGSGRAGLSLTILSKYMVIIPSKNEQDSIACKLESIDKVIFTETSGLNKYQQLKQAIMSDLLTGKVRVKYEEDKVEYKEGKMEYAEDKVEAV